MDGPRAGTAPAATGPPPAIKVKKAFRWPNQVSACRLQLWWRNIANRSLAGQKAAHRFEMKHATSRMLFAYWDQLRGERAAPERADIVPGAIRHVLADTFILGLDEDGLGRFRLAGTRCSALFGRDLKDQSLASLWPDARQAEIQRHVGIVASETAALVAGLVGTAENGWTVDLELLLLPLRHRGQTSARALGALSPVRMPSWIGLVPVVSLETTTSRIVNTGRDRRPAPAWQRELLKLRQERFVVHQGGRQ